MALRPDGGIQPTGAARQGRECRFKGTMPRFQSGGRMCILEQFNMGNWIEKPAIGRLIRFFRLF
jgi:hypothetical protein